MQHCASFDDAILKHTSNAYKYTLLNKKRQEKHTVIDGIPGCHMGSGILYGPNWDISGLSGGRYTQILAACSDAACWTLLPFEYVEDGSWLSALNNPCFD